jgi:Domain of unknown function (DUF4124)
MRCSAWPGAGKVLSVAYLFAALIITVDRHALADEMYKTVDAQGGVVYSDHPLSPASQRINVQVTQGNTAEASRLTKEQALINADAAQQAQQAQRDADAQKKRAALDSAQKQRCDAARTRYSVFAAGGRVFKSDEQGNRVYYSDQEIDEQRAASKAAMDVYCAR